MNRRALLASGALTALSVAAPLRLRAADADPMTVSYQTIDATTSFWAAIEQGYFTREGLDVQGQPSNGGAAQVASAVVAGSLTSVGLSVVSMAAAHEKGLPLKYIALDSMYSSVTPSSQLLVEKDSPIRTAHDLSGKIVAVNALNGLAYLAVLAWMEKNGGDPKSVKFIEIPFPAMPVALTSHRVDAALVAEPALSQAKADARVLADAYTAIAPRFLIDGWVASASWISAHPVQAAKFHRAMKAAAAWANRNHDATALIASKYSKADPAAIKNTTRAVFPEDERNVAALIQPVIDVAAKYGVLQTAFPAGDLLAHESFG